MIHELRSYRLKPGMAGDYLGLLAREGLPLVTRHLPLMGYWLAESGGLNVIHHLWSYADWAEREAARLTLSGEEAWMQGFIPRAFAMVVEQENRLMRLDHSSAGFDAALAQRRQSHPAVPAGQPIFTGPCAGVLIGTAEPVEAIARWSVLSGDPRPVALLPRQESVMPDAVLTGAEHQILRPLVFSPL